MKILAIETSCDETAVAIVENGQKVLSQKIASQVDLHNLTGGVVPEVAAREHPLKIWPLINEVLKESKVDLKDIDAVAATAGPGLLPSLLTGYLTGRTIAEYLKKPFVPVQHVLGHVYANFLEREKIDFPFVCLTVSGGHNQIMLMRDYFDFEIIGSTRDDASGEAFDKVAKLLGLGYPGGPIISKLAEKGKPGEIDLPLVWLNENNQKEKWDQANFDFSFSGIKSAVRRLVLSQKKITKKFQADVSYAFQYAVTKVLATKLVYAAKKYNAKEVHLAGGVSANKFLREMIKQEMEDLNIDLPFRVPESFVYCTDNAAMVGAVAYFQIKEGVLPCVKDADPGLDIQLYKK